MKSTGEIVGAVIGLILLLGMFYYVLEEQGHLKIGIILFLTGLVVSGVGYLCKKEIIIVAGMVPFLGLVFYCWYRQYQHDEDEKFKRETPEQREKRWAREEKEEKDRQELSNLLLYRTTRDVTDTGERRYDSQGNPIKKMWDGEREFWYSDKDGRIDDD